VTAVAAKLARRLPYWQENEKNQLAAASRRSPHDAKTPQRPLMRFSAVGRLESAARLNIRSAPSYEAPPIRCH